jgi:hypothetical protein
LHEASISSTSAQSWKSSAQGWHHINISTKLASHQHHHETGNLQHEAGISPTSAQSWKSSARGWHFINISMKLKIFSTSLASHQH